MLWCSLWRCVRPVEVQAQGYLCLSRVLGTHETCTSMCCPFIASLLRAVLAPPSLSYKPVTSAPHDRGNISHDPTRDSSRDPFATRTSRDLSAHDPGNLRPHDPGKITHDLSRNWSSTTSPAKMCFGCASNPLINTWQIMGTINKMRPLNNQQDASTKQSTNMRRDSINEDAAH